MIKPGERRCIRSSKTRLRSRVERSENSEAFQGDMMPTIGLIGLGNAGRPIGERILARGYPLTVYDLNPATVDNMVGLGARRAASARDAVSEITLIVLPSSIEVRRAVFGEAGAFEAVQPGMTFIDLSGTDPEWGGELQSRLWGERVALVGGTLPGG